MMRPTFHITPEMMKMVLDYAFSSAVTQSDKDAAKHLRNTLVATHSAYQSVVFDIMEMATRHDRRGLAEIRAWDSTPAASRRLTDSSSAVRLREP